MSTERDHLHFLFRIGGWETGVLPIHGSIFDNQVNAQLLFSRTSDKGIKWLEEDNLSVCFSPLFRPLRADGSCIDFCAVVVDLSIATAAGGGAAESPPGP